MASGPKTTTTSTNTQTGATSQQGTSQQQGSGSQSNTGQTSTQATSTSTPNLPDWFLPFKQAIAGQYGNLYSQFGQMAQHPLYGQAQQANYQEALNRQLGQARQDSMSSLASSGALNSGRAAQVNTGLQLGGVQQLQNYLANVPLLNRQAQSQALAAQGSALNGASALTVPYGQTTTSSSLQDMISNMLSSFNNSGSTSENGTSNSSSNGTQTQQQSGGLLNSILTGLISAGTGALTGGLSKVFSGGGGGGMPSTQTLQNLPTQTYTDPFQWGMTYPGNGGGGNGFGGTFN